MAAGRMIPPDEVERVPHDTEEAWLATRAASGIGGSDAAALFSCNPYKSTYELWAEKSGLLESSFLESEAMRWGKLLEPFIAERYADVTGRELIDHGRFTVFRRAGFPFAFCTPDREVVGDERGRGMVSVKNVTQFKAGDWEDEPPVYYQIQLQHELAVTGSAWGSFAVLIGGNKFHWLDVKRNDAFIETLMARVADMQRRVAEGNPPPVDGSDRTAEALKKLYAGANGETITLAPSMAPIAEEYEAIKEHIKALAKQAQERKSQILAAMGSASLALLPDGSGYARTPITKKPYEVKAQSYVELRRKAAK